MHPSTALVRGLMDLSRPSLAKWGLFPKTSSRQVAITRAIKNAVATGQAQQYMPAEWHAHKQCWIGWPCNENNWRAKAEPAQKAFVDVAKALSQFEPVVFCAPPDQVQKARSLLPVHIGIKELGYEASWFRDNAPTFVLTRGSASTAHTVAGVTWMFNAYGGLYKPHLDLELARGICGLEGVPSISSNMVLEGGSIHVDGEGTLITTAECLLNPNRNPGMDKDAIEVELKRQLGVKTIIWIPRGIVNDETSGHVDNMAVFARPGVVLLAWTDDKEDPQYERCVEALAVLSTSRDAAGRILQVVKLPLPPLQYYQQEEYDSLANHAKQHYTPGRRLPASYINFYMPNGGIIMPAFGSEKADAAAAAVLAHVFPERRIVPVYSREILLGGGNIHCITQQQPLSWGMQGALQLLKPLPIMHAVTIIQSYCSLLPKCTKFNTSPTKTSFHYFLIFLFALSPCPLFFCFLPSFRYRLAVRSSLPPSL